MTSTLVYDRNTLEWEQAILDALVEEGDAKVFPTPAGNNYVVKIGTQSFAVRPHQVVASVDPLANIPDPEDLAFLRSVIVDHDTEVDYLQQVAKTADERGTSVEEETDGEYTTDASGAVVLAYEPEQETWEAVRRQEDALLARFGV